MKPLNELIRANVLRMEPYSSARDDYKGKTASVFLDANENPFNSPINRYPDPRQSELKAALCQIKKARPEQLFLGNGSDEAIDLMYRAFCEPRLDNVVAIAPTYGMYEVCAEMNDVAYRKVMLAEGFTLSAEKLLAATDEKTKLIWICSPNNPTGNDFGVSEIEKVIKKFQGLVIVDEAYIDFANRQSLVHRLEEFPNLVVLQTFSKAWGCAAIRLGMAFASPEIIGVMNKIKYPYNVNLLTQQEALRILERHYEVERWVENLIEERARLIQEMKALPLTVKIYHTDANFFLVKVTDAVAIYNYLVNEGIIVRNRHSVALCGNCLRITVGKRVENERLIEALKQWNTASK